MLLTIWACTSPEGPEGYVLGERMITEPAWDTVFVVGGEVDDTTLLRPRLIAADGGVLYAYDYFDGRLKAFDHTGRLQWTYGTQGGGPGEFRNPTHIAAAPDGSIWLADGGALRGTVITTEGTFDQHIPYGNELILRLLPMEEGILGVGVQGTEDLWVLLDGTGAPRDRGGYPTQGLREAVPQTRAPLVDAAIGGGKWAAVFPLGDTFLIYDGRQLSCVGELIEGGPFPEEPYNFDRIWAVDVAISESSLYVLARGETELERQLVDEYSLEDCSYVRTLRLPRVLQAMAYGGNGTFYFYHEEPAPALVGLRPVLPE